MVFGVYQGEEWSWNLVEKELVDFVVEVRRNSDRIMTIKVLVGSEFVNVVSVYAPHKG